METKVRIIAQFQEGKLEEDINNFLTSIAFDGGKLIDIKFNCAISTYPDSKEIQELYSALIFY